MGEEAMIMSPLFLYKNDYNIDVAIQPINSRFNSEGMTVTCIWWNIESPNVAEWYPLEKDMIFISKELYPNWDWLAMWDERELRWNDRKKV